MKIIIIGNGAAGIAAAESVKKKDTSISITMISNEKHPHYSRPRVIEFLSGKVTREQIIIRKKEFYDTNGINLLYPVSVKRIDVVAKTVDLDNGSVEKYDKLIIAAGAYSFIPPVEGSKNPGVFALRTIDDAESIMGYSKDKKTAAVIGGGLLGIEAAISLTARGLQTTVVEFFDRLLPRQLDKDGAAILRAMLETKGLKFMLPKTAVSIAPSGDSLTVNFKDNTSLTAGLVMFSSGIRCNLKIIDGTGIASDKGIKINNFMETNIPDVYACGDITEYNGMNYGIWPAAREQGTAAGLNAAGEKTEYKGSVMSAKLKVAGIDLGSMGNIEADAQTKTFTKQSEGIFKRVFIKDGKLSGAILLGDTADYQKLQEIMKKGGTVANPEELV